MTTTATPRRRVLDAHRSKSRVRLGSCQQTWAHLKNQLGFSLHSQLAQHLLESYFSKVCVRCSAGDRKGGTPVAVLTSRESLQELVLLVHRHGQTCPRLPLPCFITHTSPTVETSELGDSSEVRVQYTCEGGHQILWSPDGIPDAEQTKTCTNEGQISTSHLKLRVQKRLETSGVGVKRREMMARGKTKQKRQQNSNIAPSPTKQGTRSELFGEMKNMVTDVAQHVAQQIGNDETTDLPLADHEAPTESPEPSSDHHTEGQPSPASNEKVAVLNAATRGTHRREDQTAQKSERDSSSKPISPQSLKDRVYRTGDKRKRRPIQKVLLSCEFDGCDKIFSSRQYLNHHVKYQHLQQKTFTCSHSTCKKSFNFKKHLKEHEKSHSDQRDFICEFCARAFRTNSNLIIHRRIHTGEKPLQCEVCGFTCRQKASLNWHMRKHNAQSTYQFPCEICGRRFEKRDNVTAHRSKSHPDHSAHTTEDPNSISSPSDSA